MTVDARPEPDRERVVRLLHTLRDATSDGRGAQRVAWTETWHTARELLLSELAGLPVEVTTDAAGNVWARLSGGRPETVVMGSHLDSVPGGGWLDGAYGVMCGLEALRTLADRADLPCSVALVDWADEEGARFGRSLFGSAACAGTLAVVEVRDLTDRDGERLEDVVGRWGVRLDRLGEAEAQLEPVAAYLEAHIEQGPVMERSGTPVAAVTGTAGVERHLLSFSGQTAHSGTTPIEFRHDAFVVAATTALAVRETATRHNGMGTVGVVRVEPGIPTAVPGTASIVVDLRHHEADALEAMRREVHEAARAAAVAEGCTLGVAPLFRIEPRHFDPRLVEIVRGVCAETTGADPMSIPSGALHDATEMATAVPTAMLFTSSRHGLSHTTKEDTPPEHLKLGVGAFYDVVSRVVDIVGRTGKALTPLSATNAS
ncbi:MAG TPA: Zn-dependent hydrolase [Acidimicrobiales bacterium]|nr:Zn-dependent hydrolase [Acidimicrobiales bacterium]